MYAPHAINHAEAVCVCASGLRLKWISAQATRYADGRAGLMVSAYEMCYCGNQASWSNSLISYVCTGCDQVCVRCSCVTVWHAGGTGLDVGPRDPVLRWRE